MDTNSIVNCVSYANGHRVANLELEDISTALTADDQFVWLGLRDPRRKADENHSKRIRFA